MGKFFIESKADKARAQRVQDAIDSGDMPQPPTTGQKINECAVCKAQSVLLSFVSGYGRVCEYCIADITADNNPAQQPRGLQ